LAQVIGSLSWELCNALYTKMGIVLARAEVVKGLEPLTVFNVHQVREMFNQFEEVCTIPALWERAFYELLGCFKTPEACSRAFRVIDTDGNGFVDARETLGTLAILSKGHLTDRMTLLYEIFDLNREKEMAFDECFMMLRRTMAGLRKMVGIHSPPEKIIHNMTKQVWKQARKHRDVRIMQDDWYNWWIIDAACRNALKMFEWRPEDRRGLPTPDQFTSIDYTKGTSETERGDKGDNSNQLVPRRGSKDGSRPSSARRQIRRTSSFSATVDQKGEISKPTQDDEEGFASPKNAGSNLLVPGGAGKSPTNLGSGMSIKVPGMSYA